MISMFILMDSIRHSEKAEKNTTKKHRALLKRKVFHVWKVRGTTNRDSSPVALSPYDCLRHLTYRPRSPPATQSSKKSTLGPRGFHVGFHPTLGWWFSLIPFLFHHQDSHLQTKKDLTLFALSQLLNEKKLTNVSLSTNHHHPPSFMLLDPQYQPCHCLTARQTLHCWGGSFEHRATPPSSLRCTSMTIGKYGYSGVFLVIGVGAVLCLTSSFLWRGLWEIEILQWTNLFDLGTIRRRAWIRRRVSALKCRQKSSQWVASVLAVRVLGAKLHKKTNVELKGKTKLNLWAKKTQKVMVS